ncbi:MAG: phosphoenolpyruvate--protein phosphotransferase [Alphaproteobacteria bacterium]|nr:phosphoenolpyruvate--protein phosphotransferase [Alphaproteobacteria bacterium]
MPLSLEAPRILLRRLRDLMATGGEQQVRLDKTVSLIASVMEGAVCSVYLRRHIAGQGANQAGGGILELCASVGLDAQSVHKTHLTMGEGLVGDIATHKRPLNLAEAKQHPNFAPRPETGEDAFHSFVGVPILHGGDVRGVLVVQNKSMQRFVAEEVEALEIVAMVLAEVLAASGDIEDVRAPDAPHTYIGIGLVEGVALGQVKLHEPRVEVSRLFSDDSEAEQRRLNDAIYVLRRNVDELLATKDVSHAGEHLAVLESYRMFANDRGWLRRIHDAVQTGLTAEAAVNSVNGAMRARLGQQRDAYLRARLHDFDDLSNRLLRILSGRAVNAAHDKLHRNTILVARMMGPAELLDYDRRNLRGLLLEEGAMGAHVSIVARALNIPLIGDVAQIAQIAYDGQAVVLDGTSGEVHLNPPSTITDTFRGRALLEAKRQKRYARLRDKPALTRDNVRIRLDMNAGLAVDTDKLITSGADNIGLFRTELQFMVAARLPRLQEQQEFYAQVLEKAEGRDVVFRTLDIGGDKVLPYLALQPEENPALGWRAMRIALDRPALLRYQLRALLRAAKGRHLSVMFPLITTTAEFVQAKQILHKEYALSQRLGHGVASTLSVGTMLEVPALVWQLDELLPQVDFLSIGTNDLMQFFFAADRANPRLAGRYDILSAPALRLLSDIRVRCDAHNVPVSICGEVGGGTLEAMTLMGIGFSRFSLPSGAVGAVKRMVRSVNLERLRTCVSATMIDNPDNMRDHLKTLAQEQGVKL